MLSIIASPTGDVVHIHGDADGLLALETEVRRLRQMAERQECRDGHLLSAAWGGAELAETMLAEEREGGWQQVHHLKVFGWSAEWGARHGLAPSTRS